jgi:transcriptional regulator with XRE-family HTH domain
METNITTGDIAREVRAELGRQQISGAALGRHLFLSQAAISRRLRGVLPFGVNELQTIAELFGLSLTALLGRALPTTTNEAGSLHAVRKPAS